VYIYIREWEFCRERAQNEVLTTLKCLCSNSLFLWIKHSFIITVLVLRKLNICSEIKKLERYYVTFSWRFCVNSCSIALVALVSAHFIMVAHTWAFDSIIKIDWIRPVLLKTRFLIVQCGNIFAIKLLVIFCYGFKSAIYFC